MRDPLDEDGGSLFKPDYGLRWVRATIIASVEALLLVVEDDSSLREVIELGLQREGYRIVTAADGPAGLKSFETHKPDLVLLDVMLPGLDGFEVCREIRRNSLVPIIMLTARTSTVDIVVGLESGADDYLTKPFEFPELVARIRSVLRRSVSGRGEGTASRVLRVGDLTLDPAAFTVSKGGFDVSLTATEFKLLLELVRHRGQVLSRDQLLERVWGYSYLGDSRLVDVHVQRLRAKVEDQPTHPSLIVTVRGVGYKASR